MLTRWRWRGEWETRLLVCLTCTHVQVSRRWVARCERETWGCLFQQVSSVQRSTWWPVVTLNTNWCRMKVWAWLCIQTWLLISMCDSQNNFLLFHQSSPYVLENMEFLISLFFSLGLAGRYVSACSIRFHGRCSQFNLNHIDLWIAMRNKNKCCCWIDSLKGYHYFPIPPANKLVAT